MKEVIHDVEWCQSKVATITLQKDPKLIKFSSEAHGGEVEVIMPVTSTT